MHESLGYGFEVEPDLGNRRMGPKLTFRTKTEEVASKIKNISNNENKLSCD